MVACNSVNGTDIIQPRIPPSAMSLSKRPKVHRMLSRRIVHHISGSRKRLALRAFGLHSKSGTKQNEAAAVTVAKEEPTLGMRNAHLETKPTTEM